MRLLPHDERATVGQLAEALENWVIALIRAGTMAGMAGNEAMLRARVRETREMLFDALERLDQ